MGSGRGNGVEDEGRDRKDGSGGEGRVGHRDGEEA